MSDKTIWRSNYKSEGSYRKAINTYRTLLCNKGYEFDEYDYSDRYIFGNIR